MTTTTATHTPLDTDPPRMLPIDVKPQPTDTVDSYIRRLARANHLPPGDLHGYLCTPPGFRGRPRLERLAAASGRAACALQHVLIDLRCAGCGRLQPAPAETGRRARWCSPACRKTAHRKLQQKPQPARDVESICERCGAPVLKSRPVRWCSRRCAAAAQRQTLREDAVVECERCGERFRSARKHRWCSPACREAAWALPTSAESAPTRWPQALWDGPPSGARTAAARPPIACAAPTVEIRRQPLAWNTRCWPSIRTMSPAECSDPRANVDFKELAGAACGFCRRVPVWRFR